jgi:excisionase family DNA binding protein
LLSCRLGFEEDAAMESMMTVRQVAEQLGVHENWVYDQVASGALPSYKIGGTRRIDRDEFRRWIADHREPEHKQTKRRASNAKKKPSGPKAARRPADDSQPRLFE